MESINKLSKMNAAIIDGKIIIETIKLKFWACQHVRLKRYWRKKRWKKLKKLSKNLKNLKKIKKKSLKKIKKKFKKKF